MTSTTVRLGNLGRPTIHNRISAADLDQSASWKKCIVVEDDPFWMCEVCNALATEGVEVFPANTAAEGLRLLDRHPKAAMIIDIILPDQDGLEVLRDARAKCPDLRALAISGGGRLGPTFYLKLADMLGADAVIEKPFTAEQLLVSWRQALRKTG